MKRYLLTATVLSMSVSLMSSNAYAITDAQAQALIERIDRLESEVKTLRTQLKRQSTITKTTVDEQQNQEIATIKRQQSSTTAYSADHAKVSIGKKGFEVSSVDGKYGFGVKGYYQFDARHYLNDGNNTGKDDFLARRLRPIFEAKAEDFSFKLMPDFSGTSGSPKIYDAFVEYDAHEAFNIKLGKFKQPTGLERLQSDADISLIERGHATNLTPDRDMGLEFFGTIFSKKLSYEIGVFNGTYDGDETDIDADDKKDIAARVMVSPFSEGGMEGLSFGVGGTLGDREGSPTNTILGDYKTPGQQAFFKYRSGALPADTSYADGTQYRVIPQALYYNGPIGVSAEYAVSSSDITRGNTSTRLNHTAYSLIGAYVLTGEDVHWKGAVKPARPFSLKGDGWGAFELVGRVGATMLDGKTFPTFADLTKYAKKAESYGTGVNWFLTDNFSLMLDYEYTSFDGGAVTGDRPEEQVVLSRAQVRF